MFPEMIGMPPWNLVEKKIITRFDDSYILSFDLPVLKSLLDLGFEIKYDNSIHLKLYIADNEAYIFSSNLTKGGFEDNVELTVKIENENTDVCKFSKVGLVSFYQSSIKTGYQTVTNSWQTNVIGDIVICIGN